MGAAADARSAEGRIFELLAIPSAADRGGVGCAEGYESSAARGCRFAALVERTNGKGRRGSAGGDTGIPAASQRGGRARRTGQRTDLRLRNGSIRSRKIAP